MKNICDSGADLSHCGVSVSRREMLGLAAMTGASVALGADAVASAPVPTNDRTILQKEIDEVPADVVGPYFRGETDAASLNARYPALARLDGVLGQVIAEAKKTVVTDRPAVWFVYNMGVIVRTREALFSIDLCHRRAQEYAKDIDFAIISHNHDDHFTRRFYFEMDKKLHKTVITNFADNYGAAYNRGVCGFARGEKTFKLKDVTIRTYESNHNHILHGFVMPVEVEYNGYTILHVGDTFNLDELKPSRPPDLWIHHAYCWGLVTDRGVPNLKPKLTVVAHLQELHHRPGHARYTFADGEKAKQVSEKLGSPAVVPA